MSKELKLKILPDFLMLIQIMFLNVLERFLFNKRTLLSPFFKPKLIKFIFSLSLNSSCFHGILGFKGIAEQCDHSFSKGL